MTHPPSEWQRLTPQRCEDDGCPTPDEPLRGYRRRFHPACADRRERARWQATYNARRNATRRAQRRS